MLSLARTQYGNDTAVQSGRKPGAGRYRRNEPESRSMFEGLVPTAWTGNVRSARPVRNIPSAASIPITNALATKNPGNLRASGLLRREGIEAYQRAGGAISSNLSPSRIRSTAAFLQNSTPPATRSASVIQSTLRQTSAPTLTSLAVTSRFAGGPSVNFQGLLQEGIRQYQLYSASGRGLTGSLLSATAGLYNKVGALTANASTLFTQI